MIGIDKREEPEELTTYRLRKDINPTYEGMKGAMISQFISGGANRNLYDIVLSSLWNEQGGICAYCMKRIPQKKNPPMTIEHLEPQNQLSEIEKLDYRNMLAVCNGNRGSNSNNDKTCDAKRATLSVDKQKLVLNPLKQSTLKRIVYSENGYIKSDIPEEDDCLNKVLNLNHRSLVDARASALLALQQRVEKDNKNKTAKASYFEKLYRHYNEQEMKPPFVGILMYWLNNKRKCRNK